MTTTTWDMRSGIHQFGPRTNSLAFSQRDCHSCVSLNQKCDRRRPRCGTCEESQRRCGGFAVDLVWKVSSTPASGAAPSSVTHQRRTQGEQLQCTAGQMNFKFVRGRPVKRRNKSPFNFQETSLLFSKFQLAVNDEPASNPPSSVGAEAAPTTINTTVGENNSYNFNEASCSVTQSSLEFSWLAYTEMSPSLPGTAMVPYLTRSTYANTDKYPGLSLSWGSPSFPGKDPIGENDDDYGGSLGIPMGVTYRSLAHKYSTMLTRFNKEFCVMPLTLDCRHNPFRPQASFTESYTFLFHAVMAISSHHLARRYNCAVLRNETYNHWSTALQLFRTGLSTADFSPLLDTILILINFESTQSAYGSIEMHLGGALHLLSQPGVAGELAQSPRLRAQLAMLVWWDVTSALTSRREPRLAGLYLDFLSEYDEKHEWSFVALNGCPVEFVRSMAHLAKLAEVYEKTTQMDGALFDNSRVETVVQQVKGYTYEHASEIRGLAIEQETHGKQNQAYCVEAWRHAIILYALRAFTPRQDENGLQHIKHSSRIILDSARCIPPTEFFQKQLLLPVFLAAAEVGDECNRSFVRQYCEHWSKRCNFDQFTGMAELLEDIWNDWSPCTRDVYWWGVKVGRSKGSREYGEGAQGLSKELLLG